MRDLPPRFEALLRRDLGARDVFVFDGDVGPDPDEQSLQAALPRGRTLRVTLADPAADRAALQRRLDVLVTSFRELLEETAAEGVNRSTPGEKLHDELRDLASAAGAVDALVIDAQSEVVWGAAEADDSEPHVVREPAEVIPLDRATRGSVAPPAPPRSPAERAIEHVRALPSMPALAKGLVSLAEQDREGDPPLLARSFAQIYVLLLVFDEPFDELRAERALQNRLGLVERLVLALPPLDPTPGARAVRRSR